jgi:hypothetical protein
MKVSELFDLKYGVNLELLRCDETVDSDGINFVARTSQNNGVVASVKPIDGVMPQMAGTLSCATSGSVLSTFLQERPYYSGRDLYVLTPKINLTNEQKLFYAMVIMKNGFRYSYGRAANKTLKDIDIPTLEECNKIIGDVKIKPIETKIDGQKAPQLKVELWKEFHIKDVFDCKTTKAMVETEKGNIPYVTRTATNNGIHDFVSLDNYIENDSNCITIGAEGVYAFYQDKPFVAGVKVYTLRNSNLNAYRALFICTLLNLQNFKYSYGRARILTKLKEEKILLPIKDNGEIDWQFMEDYIKNLPYADVI